MPLDDTTVEPKYTRFFAGGSKTHPNKTTQTEEFQTNRINMGFIKPFLYKTLKSSVRKSEFPMQRILVLSLSVSSFHLFSRYRFYTSLLVCFHKTFGMSYQGMIWGQPVTVLDTYSIRFFDCISSVFEWLHISSLVLFIKLDESNRLSL